MQLTAQGRQGAQLAMPSRGIGQVVSSGQVIRVMMTNLLGGLLQDADLGAVGQGHLGAHAGGVHQLGGGEPAAGRQGGRGLKVWGGWGSVGGRWRRPAGGPEAGRWAAGRQIAATGWRQTGGAAGNRLAGGGTGGSRQACRRRLPAAAEQPSNTGAGGAGPRLGLAEHALQLLEVKP